MSEKYRNIPRITFYHHFRFNKASPGTVVVRELADSADVPITICSKSVVIDPSILPDVVTPKGMVSARKWYLHEEISQFCSSPKAANITCPRPDWPKPNQAREPTVTSGTKRKRTCSHCHQEGHTKTKKGKISCPQLL